MNSKRSTGSQQQPNSVVPMPAGSPPFSINLGAHKAHEMSPATPRHVEFHIGELVLHGFSPADRRPIADALEAELANLIVEQSSSLRQSFAIEHTNLGALRIRQGEPSHGIGAGVAAVIFERLRNER